MISMPDAVLVQIARVCNLRCRMCGWTAWSRNNGFMTAELFSRVLDEMRANHIDHLNLTNPQGEPLLHPHAIEFIRDAIRREFTVHLNTNLTPLTGGKVAALADFAHSGRFSIQASFSGYDRASHESVYVCSSFELTSAKLRGLANGVPAHALTVFGIVYDPGEVERHIAYLQSLGLQRHQITLSIPDNFAGLADHAHETFTLKRNLGTLRMCHLLEHYLLVYDDGRVSACACRDSEAVMEIGDITTQSLAEIRGGPRYRAMLDAFIRRDLSNMPLCQKCDIPYGDQDNDLLVFRGG